MKVLSLISGGIDSPVAAGLALKQGAEVICVHFASYPFADRKAEEKVKEIVAHLSKRFNKKIELFLVPYGFIQKEIAQKGERKLQCILCRRMMLKVASEIAHEQDAVALLTGESLGQVASQTLSNLRSEYSASSFPILRPLLGMDKLEIEKLAKEFGTYSISIQPGMCCGLVPDKPATKSTVELIEAEEKKLNEKELMEKAVREKQVFIYGT